MKYTKKLSVFSIVLIFSLISSLGFPSSVLADDTTPPSADTSEVSPPPDEPVVPPQPPTSEDDPIAQVTEEPATEEPVTEAPATEAPATEASATEAPATVEPDLTPSASVDSPVDQEIDANESEEINISEIVSSAAESDIILADSDGDPLLLSTVETANTLTTGDPYIIRSGVTHRFLSNCTGQPIDAFNTCTVSATPIQAAIDFAVPEETVFVEAGTYNEQLVITTAKLTLQGDPGSLTMAGVGPNAPILDGNFTGSTVGITVYAEGFTLRGFVIQNFDTAILQQTISGNNTVTYDNNVFQDNRDGIKIVKDGGSPGIEIHYNVFQNNSGYDLINIDPLGNNIQDVNAMKNYWGCLEGPVVAFPNPEEEDYILWSARNGDGGPIKTYIHENNDWPGCAILYGDETLFAHGGSNYKPYKIILDPILTTFEEPNTQALSLEKTASPSTYDSVGDIISYSYLVTNTGNVNFDGPITVTDDKATVTCPAGALAPNESMTCSASYVITQGDFDSGSVTNIARASANGTDSNQDSATVTAVRIPALSIVKTAFPGTYDSVGDVINYSYLVTNTGNVTLSGPFVVSDDLSTDESCPLTQSLALGASITCTASYVITQADLDSGSVTNIASATNGTVTSPTDTETVTAVQGSALSIVKTANPTTYSTVGQVIDYSYLVSNTGNMTLTGPFTVTDNKATVSCPAGDLAPGASLSCSASYVITQADLDAGFVTNIASATNGTVTSPSDSETVNAVPSPAMTIAKTASPGTYGSVGDVISYSYLVTNTGNVTISGPITVTDDKAIVSCPAGDLAPGTSLTCTASYIITQSDLNAGSVTNIAFATNGTVSSPTDSETVTAIRNSGLTITKTATPATYSAVGQVINYSYLVTNTGNVTISGPIIVTDDKAIVFCPSADLAPGASLSCSASYVITQSDLNAGSVTNIAFATNGTVFSPTDTETVTAVQGSALSLVKTANPATYSTVGQVINYSYLVTNTGNVTLNGPFSVTDDKATVSCPKGNLVPGASLTCTATYTITQADLDAGFVTNIASATNGAVTSLTDTETVNAVRNPALTIVKTATPGTYDSVGDVISYSYLVTNTGNVTLPGPVTVADDKATVACPAGGLAPGAFMTCNASYIITQVNLDAGSVTNIARASANGTDSNEDSETATAIQNPALSLVKTASPGTYDSVGDVINYSYLVTNTGNVTLSGPITVFDDKATVTCPAGDLAPSSSINCSASYVITQADLDSGSVTNIARAYSGNETESNEDSETVTAIQNPALTTVKTEMSVGPYEVGATISYDIVVTNTGNVTLTGVTVTDDSAVLGACVPTQPTTLVPGASMTCSASHVVTNADVESGSYVNTASGDSDQTAPTTSSVTVNFTPDSPPPPGPQPTPTVVRPSVSFTGFIPITGGETHAIAAGIAHTCAITPEGGIQCWGNNTYGQLGNGTNTASNVPVNVLGIGGASTIVAGGNHTCVLTGGDVRCWGQNAQGQLGDGTTTDRNVPVKVLSGAMDITAGLDYTCAVMVYGQVLCWGNNDQGQLANGTKTDSTVPALAELISGISNVDAGQNKSCGLTSTGLLRCLKSNNNDDLTGQSSDPTLDVAVNRFGSAVMALTGDGVPVIFQSGTFRTISNVNSAWDIDGGAGHTCALLRDGIVKCWGSNSYGQLGRNSWTNSSDPQLVMNVSGAWQLAVGRNHACVLITSADPSAKDIQCWGLNTDGQLGNGTNANSPIPVFVK